MGLGDDIMITGLAKIEKKKHPDKQIIIGDFKKKIAFHSIIYENNPNITQADKIDRNKPVHFIDYHSENRPYINYENSNKNNWHWNLKFKPIPGEIFFSHTEELEAKKILEKATIDWNNNNAKEYKGIIFIEPSSSKIKNKQFHFKHINKDWSLNNWKQLIIKLSKDYLVIQSIHQESTKFDNVYHCESDFRTAACVMNKSDLYVGLEGGFGHIAAALNKKAVIYFGGWIDPRAIGYDFHKNLYVDIENSPCGSMTYECQHCDQCRKNVPVDYFYKSIVSEINK